MGFEIIAVTLLKIRPEIHTPEALEEAKKYTEEFPNAIFAATGEGMGMTSVISSFHKNITNYHRKCN
jgi:hypothetical protein